MGTPEGYAAEEMKPHGVPETTGRPARKADLMHDGGWFGMGGGMWLWTVIGILVVVLLVVVITKLSNKKE
jgi:hypothetical protein